MRSRSVLRVPILVALALVGVPGLGASLEGCSSTPDADTGSAEFIATTAQALSTADVQHVTLTISGPGIATPITSDLVRVGGQWKGTIGAIPVGVERTFHADAFDASNVMLYTGEVQHITITRGVNALVSLLLQQRTPPVPFRNSAPRIDTLAASSDAVVPGEGISLVATAHDPDPGEPLTYAWSATGGTFAAPNALASAWTAPAAEGTYQLTLRVTDTHSAVAALTIAIDVHTANGRGQAAVTTTLNTWPEVALVNATPTRIDVGESTALTIDAIDADHDALHYAWTATCAGSFDDAASATPHFTLAAPLPAGNACALLATVTDGRGGTNTGQISVTTGAAVPVGLAPVIDTTFQSTDAIDGLGAVTLRLSAHDPEGTAVSIAWSTSIGTLGSPSNGTGTSEIVWTAPECIPNGTTPAITATVTDASGLSTARSFPVLPSDTASCLLTVDASTTRLWRSAAGNGNLSVLRNGRPMIWGARQSFDPATGVATAIATPFPNDGQYYGSTGQAYTIWPNPNGDDDVYSTYENTHVFKATGEWVFSWLGPGCCNFVQMHAVDVARGTVWTGMWYGNAFAVDLSTSPVSVPGTYFNAADGAGSFLAVKGDELYQIGWGGTVVRNNTQTHATDWGPITLDARTRRGAIDADGSLAVTTEAGTLYKITNGAVAWSVAANAATAAVIGSDGSLYVGTTSGGIASYSSAGVLRWSQPTATAAGDLLLGDDGIVYATLGGSIVGFSTSSGMLQRQFINIDPYGGAGEILLRDGKLYARTGSYLYAFASTATNYPAGSWPVKQHDNLLTSYR